MRGRIRLEDASVMPPEAELIHVTAIPVEFDSAPLASGPPPSTTRDDFTFEVGALSGARRIFVTVSSPAWMLKTITRNDVDITDTPVDLRAGDVDGVEVLLTPRVTRLSGTVNDDRGRVVDYAIVVFAADSARWIDRSRFVGMFRPTQDGRFDTHGLPPEDYLAVALPGVNGSEWMDPEFLQLLRPQATPFTLAEGESKALQLKLTRLP
jgi:hypothetical protein